MSKEKNMYKQFGISEDIIILSNKVENELESIFKKTDKITEYNSLKVLQAFQKYNLSEMHFGSTTGYGYGDVGRDTIEDIFSHIFKAEDSLVRSRVCFGDSCFNSCSFCDAKTRRYNVKHKWKTV